ncbi:DUF397 domain-containing protein [Streptomyces sp. NPDC000351]|uniref:DUF397 domain-containing protein n=1 Tax=Streptomyces sp. NPDC000351 TaxID=3154250 RepID=UPI0033195235
MVPAVRGDGGEGGVHLDVSGAVCVRPSTALSNVEWRKSSYSGSNGGECVEVADGCPVGAVPVRDSKNPADPVLTVSAGAWSAFVDGLR